MAKKKTPPKKKNWFRWALLGCLLLPVILPFTPVGGPWKNFCVAIVQALRPKPPEPEVKTVTVEKPVEVIKEVVKEVPAPPEPLPDSFVPRKEAEVAQLFNGITIDTKLHTEQGGLASEERVKPESFRINFSVDLKVPKPSASLAELETVNPELGKMLPGLGEMVEKGRVSGFYHKMYESKTERVARSITRLDKVLDRHNFFDTETIMELSRNGRKALLIQSEMDVVSDGSDGDRLASLTDYITMSDYYQPFTSYGWPKKTDTPNPLLAKWEEQLAAYEAEYAQKGLGASRNAFLRDAISERKTGIAAMKTSSWLIAEKDPFIVMSLAMVNQTSQSPYAPLIGDYAVVICGNKIYPCIVGDAGPSFKNGEASLYLAKLINEKATPFRRPEDDLKVTYLVFPGSRDKPFGPPNLPLWREKCAALVAEMGGLGQGYELFQYTDPFAPPPAPAPPPSLVP